MEIRIEKIVFNAEQVEDNSLLRIKSSLSKNLSISVSDAIAYPPLINCHDHLIGNWYPKAGEKTPYETVDIWVEEMKTTPTFLERNKIWKGSGVFDLIDKKAELITMLGAYKNLFSGVSVVQDHISNQKDEYYHKFPIQVLKEYKQCHSISLGNWWGGKAASEEFSDAQGEMPFIVHLAEGRDENSKTDFTKFKKDGLLAPNSLIIHGIALNEKEIEECAKAGTSICWCPDSNIFLIGDTLDVGTCLKYGVNVVIGTDSTMSGSINLLEEIKFAHSILPEISPKEIFKMLTINAQKALMLPQLKGILLKETADLLLLNKQCEDPFENLLLSDMDDIKLFINDGIPILGEIEFLDNFRINRDDYYFYEKDDIKKFVFGHPEELTNKINKKLGYIKKFPFFPF